MDVETGLRCLRLAAIRRKGARRPRNDQCATLDPIGAKSDFVVRSLMNVAAPYPSPEDPRRYAKQQDRYH